MLKHISHIGIAVKDLEAGIAFYEKLGSPISTNIMALAFLVKITGIVKESSLKKAIEETVKPAFVDLNLKAMQIGFELAKK